MLSRHAHYRVMRSPLVLLLSAFGYPCFTGKQNDAENLQRIFASFPRGKKEPKNLKQKEILYGCDTLFKHFHGIFSLRVFLRCRDWVLTQFFPCRSCAFGDYLGGKKQKIKKKEEPASEVKVEEKKKPKPAPRREEAVEPGLRGIVRIAGKDMRGNLRLSRGLMRIRGIGHTMKNVAADAIAKELHISPDEKVGRLSDEQIERVDKLLSNLQACNIPPYLLNRRKDPETGKDMHVIMNDLAFAQRQDIEREKKLYTWKGYRHAYGKKVRGQRTRNTGRKGMALGVMRKTILAAAAAAKTTEKKPGAPGAPAAPAAGAPAPAAAPKAPAPAAKEAKK